MIYSEEKEKSKEFKTNYLKGLEDVITSREKQAENVRKEYAKDIFKTPEKYRKDLKNMLGWPLVGYEDDFLGVESELLSREDGYSIYRMQFEILKGLKMTGLFFKQDGEKKPLVIVQHGGLGTPELVSGMYGNTENYNDMLRKVIECGVHAFAPQLILWDDKYEVGYDRKEIDGRLKRVGSSITAVEVFGITKIIDYFEKEYSIRSFGMVGLSYGGFYTLFTTAIDTRIKSAISCSYFNRRDKYGWSDWVWQKSSEKFDDAEIACLVYPRKLCIEIGDKDKLFDYKYGVESFEKLKELCREVGTDWVEMIVFDGTHEFCKDDGPIQKLVKDLCERGEKE